MGRLPKRCSINPFLNISFWNALRMPTTSSTTKKKLALKKHHIEFNGTRIPKTCLKIYSQESWNNFWYFLATNLQIMYHIKNLFCKEISSIGKTTWIIYECRCDKYVSWLFSNYPNFPNFSIFPVTLELTLTLNFGEMFHPENLI